MTCTVYTEFVEGLIKQSIAEVPAQVLRWTLRYSASKKSKLNRYRHKKKMKRTIIVEIGVDVDCRVKKLYQ